jgi:hypothetical protein
MLVQQFRYDMSWQQDPAGGAVTANYGGSRGLEIIPSTRLEVGLFPPPYLVQQSNTPDGFGDFSFQVKYRAFSATEGQGDYFVGFFLGGTFPTGTPPNGLDHTVLSPTFAAAKGLGPWDIQSTIGANLPTSGANVLGRTIIFNTAVDYRIKGKIWPMLEQNSSFLVGWCLGRKEASLLDARTYPGLVSTRGKTSFHLWCWRADRRDAVSPVQSPLDRFCTLPVLRLRAVEIMAGPHRSDLRVRASIPIRLMYRPWAIT